MPVPASLYGYPQYDGPMFSSTKNENMRKVENLYRLFYMLVNDCARFLPPFFIDRQINTLEPYLLGEKSQYHGEYNYP